MKKILLLLSLSTFVLFSSCQKSSTDKKDYDKEDYDKDDYDKDNCFKLVYPLTYEMPDGSEIVGEDEKSMWTDIKAWYEAHLDVEEKPALQYPVEIIYGDKDDDEFKTIIINNEEEMIKAKKDCYKKKEACFKLAFPFTFIMPDGSSIAGDNEKNLWTAVKDWYEAHPDVAEKPTLVYPVDVIINDDWYDGEGETITINNEEEMMDIKKDCYDDKDPECFDLVFPYSFSMPDATTINADNEKNLWIAIKDWYESNPDSAEKPDLNYPVDIVYEDGTTAGIADEAAMILAKEACYEEDGE